VLDRADSPALLLTLRASHLRRHAGQISFPGGRLEPGDADVVAAALRETEEEIGIAASAIEPIGFLSDQMVQTGYRITPVVALLQPGFTLTPDGTEVAEVFELPLAIALDADQLSRRPPQHARGRGRQLGAVLRRAQHLGRDRRHAANLREYVAERSADNVSARAEELEALLALMRTLRDPQAGCPWDREQISQSIAPYTIEEAYEVADAIARGDPRGCAMSSGDLLFQVVFHARMAEERGQFDFAAVARGIHDKLVRRHPHVFGTRQ
jgi:NTP pyrophosphatase (non-canonical NTP hydrolase)/8-oxo-dGTP pyrophosphatase MutT (NUDIX family)